MTAPSSGQFAADSPSNLHRAAAPPASMPGYTLRLQTPVADLDPFGRLRPSGFIRLLQLAAVNASAAVGYDVDWYIRNRATWVVRRTRLDILGALKQGDELSIRTWVSDFRRVRSLRQYEVTTARLEPVARATTDWVYVDAVTGAPTTPPADLQAAFMTEGVSTATRPARIRAPLDGAATTVLLRDVELADLDSLGHVNNSHYVEFAQQALYDVLHGGGWRPQWRAAADHLQLTSIDIEYLTAALYRQTLSVRLGPLECDRQRISTPLQIAAGATPAARAVATWQWTGSQLPSELTTAVANLGPPPSR